MITQGFVSVDYNILTSVDEIAEEIREELYSSHNIVRLKINHLVDNLFVFDMTHYSIVYDWLLGKRFDISNLFYHESVIVLRFHDVTDAIEFKLTFCIGGN